MKFWVLCFWTANSTNPSPWRRWLIKNHGRTRKDDGKREVPLMALIQDSSSARCWQRVYDCFPDASKDGGSDYVVCGSESDCLNRVRQYVPEETL